MTEMEFTLEMLCCLPKELLERRINGTVENQEYWLNKTPESIVYEAIKHYDDDLYIQKREEQSDTI